MKRSVVGLTMLATSSLIGPAQARAQGDLGAGALLNQSGSFEFRNEAVVGGTMTVWYCRSRHITPNARVVFVMHGKTPEKAAQMCQIAQPHISTLDAVILAPQFATEAYPGDAYMFAGMVNGHGYETPKPQWGASVIENLFDEVRSSLALAAATYDIVGFSGGGQFVHRLVLTHPEARFRRAIAGTPGRYLLPTLAVSFPYGLGDSPVEAPNLARAFGRDFTLVLGDADTTDRVREEQAMSQGTNRFARGLRFFATATEEAAEIGAPLRWQLRILHGVDHDPNAVVTAMLELLEQDAEKGMSSLPSDE